MVIFLNPRACNPRSRRFPLSLMHLGAMLEDDEYLIVDGNVDPDPVETISDLVRSRDDIELLAVTVMPGPQTGMAVSQCRTLKSRFPRLPIRWGGYFPSMHTRVVLESSLVIELPSWHLIHLTIWPQNLRCHLFRHQLFHEIPDLPLRK